MLSRSNRRSSPRRVDQKKALQPNRWRRFLNLLYLGLFQIRSRLSLLFSHQPSKPTLTMTPWSGPARPMRD